MEEVFLHQRRGGAGGRPCPGGQRRPGPVDHVGGGPGALHRAPDLVHQQVAVAGAGVGEPHAGHRCRGHDRHGLDRRPAVAVERHRIEAEPADQALPGDLQPVVAGHPAGDRELGVARQVLHDRVSQAGAGPHPRARFLQPPVERPPGAAAAGVGDDAAVVGDAARVGQGQGVDVAGHVHDQEGYPAFLPPEVDAHPVAVDGAAGGGHHIAGGHAADHGSPDGRPQADVDVRPVRGDGHRALGLNGGGRRQGGDDQRGDDHGQHGRYQRPFEHASLPQKTAPAVTLPTV